MHPCCCHPPGSSGSSAAPPDCVSCLPGTAPQRYRIDVQGMRNRLALLCIDCASLDGSYVVERLASCYYGLNFFPAVCGYSRIELLISPGAYFVAFSISANALGSLAYARIGLTFPRDCRENGLLLGPAGFIGNCDHLVSTCRITAL